MNYTVIICIGDSPLLEKTKNFFTHSGAKILAVPESPEQLLRAARKFSPELIVFDPSSFGPAGLQTAKLLAREKVAPLLFVVSNIRFKSGIEDIIEEEAYASTYLVPPFHNEQMHIAVTTTMIIYRKLQKLEKKIIDLNRKLKEKDIIEEAKKMLIGKMNCTEPQAHRYLQKKSMERGESVKKIASMVIKKLSEEE